MGGLVLFAAACLADTKVNSESQPGTAPPEGEAQTRVIEAVPEATPSLIAGFWTKPPPIHSLPTQSRGATVIIPTETPFSTLPDTAIIDPVVGGADKIAFLDADQVWIANLDGGELTQITWDQGTKANLRWHPDGMALLYIADQCVLSIHIANAQIETVACFEKAGRLEAFEFSPDGTHTAISLDRELFVFPFDLSQLKLATSRTQLIAMADCAALAPYSHNGSRMEVKGVRWSNDGKRLAILRSGDQNGQQVDLINLLDVSHCVSRIPRLDEFPAYRFEMSGYKKIPLIPSFAWDGGALFALTDHQRNDGFGDLWIYSTELQRAFQANPVGGLCCYRDPQFSPDGRYLLFAFQDRRQGAGSQTQLYYVPYQAIGSGLVFSPLPIPQGFFVDPRAKPQPALRPAE